MPGYMIDVQALLDSELAAFGDPAANWFAVLSWCASLHQIPAGSLPNDDRSLAWIVRLGRDVNTWRKMRAAGALKGWELHSDGRLYHPMVTEIVIGLLKKSKKGRSGGLASAKSRARGRGKQPIENTTIDVNQNETHVPSRLNPEDNKRREGKGRERKGKEEGSVANATGAIAPAQSGDYRTLLFNDGLAKLMAMTGKTSNACRRYLGMCLKEAGDDASVVLRLIEDADKDRIADPTSWIAGCLKARKTNNDTSTKAESAAAGIDAYVTAYKRSQHEQSHQNGTAQLEFGGGSVIDG
jgi:hypothetical protein